MLNLDTHILLHALHGTLKPREERLLRAHSWGISAIVLWEIAKLAQLGRIELDVQGEDFTQALRRLHVWPLNWEICLALGELDFKSDPADELIAATSLVERVPLLTRDKVILRSRKVPLAL